MPQLINNISILLTLLFAPLCFGQSHYGSITGTVNDSSGKALANADVVIVGRNQSTASDSSGAFRFDQVKPGRVSLKLMRVGRQSKIIKDLLVQPGHTAHITVRMDEVILHIGNVTITPGNFAIAEGQSARQQVIEKERIAAIPATLDDIYRVLQVMPGVAFSDDYSAHFHVRGGKQNENLILLDGIEIYDPYHLKNIGGAVGVMNMDIVGNMAIMTGGFEAKYGDRLSSVVSIENRKGNTERLSGIIGAGGTGFSLLLEGPLPHGSGIISFRKSFLKEAAEILNPTDYTFSPSYYDIQSKVSIAATKNNQVTYNFLYSRDESYLERWRGESDIHADYGNSYQGIVWRSTLSPKILSEFIASHGENFWDNRIGNTEQEKLNLTENTFSWNGEVSLHDSHETGCGVSYKQIHYTYEIETPKLSQDQQALEDLVQSYFGTQSISPKSYKLAGYIQDKFRLLQTLYLNIGLRYDYFDYNDDRQVSPRLGVAWRANNSTILRAAWGKYFQAPIYAELTNKKGADDNPGAQKSIHYVFGIEKFITANFSIRAEAYKKTLEQMIGHYFIFNDDSSLPELRYGNPNSGSCRGIEFFINGRITKGLSVWATYAWSRSVIEAYFVDWDKLQLVKETIPRFTDQPHNLSLFLQYALPKSYDLSLKWRFLSGIPYTPLLPRFVDGEPLWESGDNYSARYPAYHRLDVRIGKKFTRKRAQWAVFLEVKNLYNRRNVLLYDFRIENGKHVRKAYHTLPLLPTIEFKCTF